MGMALRLILFAQLLGHAACNRAALSVEEEEVEKVHYSPGWKSLGMMSCSKSDHKQLANTESWDNCVGQAMLDPECETEPYGVYIRAIPDTGNFKCRCILKGRTCSKASALTYKPASVFTMHAKDLPKIETLELKLLATRHGLSCANLVSHWKSGLSSLGHVWMADPVLAGAGKVNSEKAGGEVKKWLDAKGLKVDALLSSVLLRAMQTAAWEYPTELFQQDPRILYTAPYLREHGLGKDNSPSKLVVQIMRSAWWTATGTTVDQRFTKDEETRESEGDWDKFKAFLASEFLPYMYEKGPGKRKTLTFAVVTHSNFMNSGEISDKCKQHYPTQPGGKVKAWNNQAVSLSYRLSYVKYGSGRTIYHIDDNPNAKEQCEAVATGMPMAENPHTDDVWELCDADIGEACQKTTSGLKTREEVISSMEDDAAEMEDYTSTPCLTGDLPGGRKEGEEDEENGPGSP